MIYKKIIRNSIALLFATIISNGLLFASNIILARNLTPRDYGTVVFVLSIAGIFMLLTDFGIYNSAMVFIPKTENKKEAISQTVSSVFELSLYLGLLGSVLFFVFSYFAPDKNFPNIKEYIMIACLWPLFFSLMKAVRGIFGGFQRPKEQLFSNSLLEMVRFTGLCTAVFLNMRIAGILFAWSVAYAVSFLVLVVALITFLNKNKMRFAINPFRAWKRKLEIARYGIHLFIPFISAFIIPYILNMYLGFLSKPQSVGFFAIALSLASVNLLMIKPLEIALLPAISGSFSEKTLSNFFVMNNMIQKYLALTGISIISLFIFFGPKILNFIYGEDYLKAAGVLTVLSCAIFFEMNRVVVDPFLKGTGSASIVSRIEIGKVLLVITTAFFLVNKYTVLGASVAYLVASFTAIALKYYFAYRKSNFVDIRIIFVCIAVLILLLLIYSLHLKPEIFYACFIIIIFKACSIAELKAIYFRFREAVVK